MRPILFISFLFLSCNRSNDHANSFFQLVGAKEPTIAIIPKNEIIPTNTALLRYPYLNPTNTITLDKLGDERKQSYIFFLGKNFITGCDICLFDEIEGIKQLSKSENVSLVFVSNNPNQRSMAVFANRHNLDNFYLLSDPSLNIKKFDNSCFLTPMKYQ